jgi:hypothetical protein
MNKFKESKHLGLYYRGLIPAQKINFNNDYDEFNRPYNTITIPIDSKELEIEIFQFQFEFYNKSLYLIGNYADNTFDTSNFSKEDKYIYNIYLYKGPIKYRPPIKGIIKNANDYVQYFIKNILSLILYDSPYESNLYTIIDSNTRLSKAFMDIYVYLSFLYDFLDSPEIKNMIITIISNINEYNANLLLYYYLFKYYTNKEPKFNYYNIPKFNYYLLPSLDKKKGSQFIYFNNHKF